MANTIRTYMAAVIAAAMLLLPAAMILGSGEAGAQTIRERVCESANMTAGGDACESGADGEGTLNNVIDLIVTYFTIIVGAVAVIMIVFGGFRYITSGGDATKVQSAKNTILYALVGLVIVVLANLIIGFVVNTSETAVDGA